MSSSDAGRVLLVLGLVGAGVGAFLALGGRLPFGQLPGDLSGSRGGFSWAFPIGTCLLLSVVLTLAINLFLRK